VTRPYRLHPLAVDDLVAAWSWYEEQVQGLGDQFLDVVQLTIESAADWPNSGAPVVYDATGEVIERKVATSGFPYTARYRVIGEVVVVMAVHHQRRHPDVGADRQP